MLNRLMAGVILLCVATSLVASAAFAQAPTSDAALLAPPATVAVPAPNVPGVDLSGPATSIFNAFSYALATVITGVIVWVGHGIAGLLGAKRQESQASASANAIRARIDDTTHDLKMNQLASEVARELVGAAMNMSGVKLEDMKDLKIRNPTLRVAAKLGEAQWADLWRWVDQDGNGQIDWLESKLHEFLPPATTAIAPAAAG